MEMKLDMQGLREAKLKKQDMLMRLRQLDFDHSGTISVESLLAIANKYDMKLSEKDAEHIRTYYRRQSVTQGYQNTHNMQTKVDYARVMEDIIMSLDNQGKIIWVYAGP